MRQQLIAKKAELLKIQQQKLEMELRELEEATQRTSQQKGHKVKTVPNLEGIQTKSPEEVIFFFQCYICVKYMNLMMCYR